MEIKTTRKCKLCKNLIVLEKDKFILYKTEEYYHYDCFIEFIKNKNKKISQEEILIIIKELQEKNYDKIKNIIDKNHLFEYITRKYELIYKPKYIYIKFEQVFNGSYKNLSESVSPEDLLDMWQRKEGYLDRTNQWKISKGEVMEGLGRMWYDLAIVLSKLSSYRKWKDQQKANENKDLIIHKKIETNYQKINKTTLNNINNNKTEEIANYIEEI